MKHIGAIILAAGSASRFGSAKQLLEVGGETLVDRACRMAYEGGCQPVIRVLGANGEEIVRKTCGHHTITVANAKWASGMGGSLATGIKALKRFAPNCEAVIILLTDQPMVSTVMLKQLQATAEHTGKTIILSDNGESTGPPALFLKCHFEELATLTGDNGAKVVAKAHSAEVALVSMPEAAWDIDSPDKWEAFNQRHEMEGQ